MATYTLIGDYGPEDNVLAIAPPYVLTGGYPALLQIEDENVAVRGGAGTALISVDRGVDGTTKAAHASGVTLEDIPPLTATPGGGIIPATVTLSSAQILDLHNTPIELVAAPGAGKWLNVHRVVGYYSHGTTEYVFTGGLMFLTFGSTSLGEFDATANQDAITPWTTTVKVVASEAVNAALVLFVTDAITDGDGTLTVTVWYSIEDEPA